MAVRSHLAVRTHFRLFLYPMVGSHELDLKVQGHGIKMGCWDRA